MQARVVSMETTGNKILEKIKDNPNKYAELCVEQYIKINPENSIKITKDGVLNIINDDEVIYNIVAKSLANITISGNEEWGICGEIITYLMFNNLNIVKKVCAELGITQKELAEKLATSKPTVERWSSTGEIPDSSKKHLEILLENEELKKENQEIKKALSILKKYS